MRGALPWCRECSAAVAVGVVAATCSALAMTTWDWPCKGLRRVAGSALASRGAWVAGWPVSPRLRKGSYQLSLGMGPSLWWKH